METGNDRRRQVVAVCASLLIHGAIFALVFLPVFLSLLQALEIVDPDELGARGARQWAEVIAPASGAGRDETEGVAAEGERGVMAVRLVSPPIVEEAEEAEEETEDDAPVEEIQIREEPPVVEEKTQDPVPVKKTRTRKKTPAVKEKAVKEKAVKGKPDAPADKRKGKGRVASARVKGKDAAPGAGVGGSTRKTRGVFVSGDAARALLPGWTLVGFNGFLDGSVGAAQDKKRQRIRWKVYYKRNGRLEARYTRLAALVPHGPLRTRNFSSAGRWWIDGEHLCQEIDTWFYGGTACYDVRRNGDALGMYYASCYGISRCYKGRLGPRGVLLRGRRF